MYDRVILPASTKIYIAQGGLNPELVNQHTLLEASLGVPVQQADGPTLLQQAAEAGHLLDELTVTDVEHAARLQVPAPEAADVPVADRSRPL